MTLGEDLTGDSTLDVADEWLCQRSRDYREQADVRSLRCRWVGERSLPTHPIDRYHPYRLVTKRRNASPRGAGSMCSGCGYLGQHIVVHVVSRKSPRGGVLEAALTLMRVLHAARSVETSRVTGPHWRWCAVPGAASGELVRLKHQRRKYKQRLRQ